MSEEKSMEQAVRAIEALLQSEEEAEEAMRTGKFDGICGKLPRWMSEPYQVELSRIRQWVINTPVDVDFVRREVQNIAAGGDSGAPPGTVSRETREIYFDHLETLAKLLQAVRLGKARGLSLLLGEEEAKLRSENERTAKTQKRNLAKGRRAGSIATSKRAEDVRKAYWDYAAAARKKHPKKTLDAIAREIHELRNFSWNKKPNGEWYSLSYIRRLLSNS